MEIRQFRQSDEKDVVALWNSCCKNDQIDLNKFRKQALYDDNFDESLVWVAVNEKKIVGFLMATKRKFPYMERGLEPERGWINVLFVAPDAQKQKIGSELLEKAEQTLKQRGVKNITLGAYSPNYFFAGIDEVNYPDAARFFQKHRYQPGELHYSMGMDLTEYQMPEYVQELKCRLENSGYQFLAFKEEYSLELLNFLRDQFGGGWKRSALNAMREKTAEELILIVLNQKQEICGFCMHAMDGNLERFGPIGISQKERNLKIGSILFHHQLKRMKDKGCRRMFFMTTDEAGKRFYERNGLHLIRTYRDYRKNI